MSKAGLTKKEAYFEKLTNYLNEYSTIFLVNVDNVGSNQMHQIRQSLRKDSVVLLGKNTMVRKCLRNLREERPEFEPLLPMVYGNIGFVFTRGDLKDVRDRVTANRVRAPAKAGVVAPDDVSIPAGNSGMDPGKTNFFQALGIPTKITKGTIEIINDIHLIKAGDKVGASEAALLNMLNVSPFTYGLSVAAVYDNGDVFSPEILDVDDDALIGALVEGIRNMACLSFALKHPTVAVVPHLLVQGYKNLIAISLVSDYVIDGAKKVLFFPVFARVWSACRGGSCTEYWWW